MGDCVTFVSTDDLILWNSALFTASSVASLFSAPAPSEAAAAPAVAAAAPAPSEAAAAPAVAASSSSARNDARLTFFLTALAKGF